METSYKGIVVGTKNYKENDKIIILFTVEGIVNIVARGVKKANAKLKFAKELFTFGDFFVVQKNNFNILTACDVIENFSPLIEPEKFLIASDILNIILKILNYNSQNYFLFIELLTAFKAICYENVLPDLVLAKFYLKCLEYMGYKLSLSKCSNCGQNFLGKQYLNLDSGEVVCVGCKNFNNIEINNSTLTNLRILNNTEYPNLKNIKLINLENTLFILKTDFESRCK